MERIFSSMGSFFVLDKSGYYYPATFLTYADGTPITNPVTKSKSPYWPEQIALYSDQNGTILPNPNNYLVVPSADYMNELATRGKVYGQLLKSSETGYDADAADNSRSAAAEYLTRTFFPKLGYGDAQYQSGYGAAVDTGRNIWDKISRSFGGDKTNADTRWIPAFTDAGNYGVSVFFGSGGLPVDSALHATGSANQTIGGNNTSAPYGNSPWGYAAINQGHADVIRRLPSTNPFRINMSDPGLDGGSMNVGSNNPDMDPWAMPGRGILSGVRLGPNAVAGGFGSDPEALSPWDQAVRDVWRRRMQDAGNQE